MTSPGSVDPERAAKIREWLKKNTAVGKVIADIVAGNPEAGRLAGLSPEDSFMAGAAHALLATESGKPS